MNLGDNLTKIAGRCLRRCFDGVLLENLARKLDKFGMVVARSHIVLICQNFGEQWKFLISGMSWTDSEDNNWWGLLGRSAGPVSGGWLHRCCGYNLSRRNLHIDFDHFLLDGSWVRICCQLWGFFLANWIKKRLDYRLRWRKSVVATMVATVEHWTLLQLQWTVYDCGAFTLFSATLCVIWIGKTQRGAYAVEEYKTLRGAVQQLVIWAGFFTPTCSGSLAWRSDYEAVPNKPGYTKATWFNFFECPHIDLAGTVSRGFVQAKTFPIIFA